MAVISSAILVPACVSPSGGSQGAMASITLTDVSKTTAPKFVGLNDGVRKPSTKIVAPTGLNTATILISWSAELREDIEFLFELPSAGNYQIHVIPYPPPPHPGTRNLTEFSLDSPSPATVFIAPPIMVGEELFGKLGEHAQKKKYMRENRIQFVTLRLESENRNVLSFKKYDNPSQRGS